MWDLEIIFFFAVERDSCFSAFESLKFKMLKSCVCDYASKTHKSLDLGRVFFCHTFTLSFSVSRYIKLLVMLLDTDECISKCFHWRIY
jgi:hypothetical protein